MRKFNLLTNILLTGLIAGTLDILSAIIILAKGNALGTLKYIASGAFGKAATDGGYEMAALGLLFHYIIAMSWTAGYFLLYPKLPFLRWNKWFNAIAYGLIVQTGMRFVFVPLSQISQGPFNWSSFLENAVILMFAIGLPNALIAESYYQKNEVSK
jgi:hypothetical protein